MDITIQNAIEIESSLNKQNSLRNDTKSILFNFESSNPNKTRTVCCQLFCMKASCIYCKSKEHVSYHCRTAKDDIPLICKLCSTEGHSIDACKLGTISNNHCQYCQNMGHEVRQCPTITAYELCWKCKERGHDPLTSTNSARITESCEASGSASHTVKNCPSATCKRCNNLGHLMKYCTINKRMIWCAICMDEGHEAVDCESAKILMMKNRQKSSQNREICQFCDTLGHSAKTCRKMNNNQQNTFQNNNYNPSNKAYEYRDKNRNRFSRTNHQNSRHFSNNSSSNYRGNFKTQNIKCEYCKFTGHTLEDCRKLKSLMTQIKCSFCNKNGQKIDNCHEIKMLQDKSDKFCKICKNTNHITEECKEKLLREEYLINKIRKTNKFFWK